MVIEQVEDQRKNNNNHIYDGTSNALELNFFQGVFLNLNYRNVMHFFKYIEKEEYDKACFVIGINEAILAEKGEKFIENLYKYLSSERFLSENANDTQAKLKSLKKRGVITNEEEEQEFMQQQYEKQKRKQVFCHFGDFDLIYSLFIEKFGIDLISKDINYFIYRFHLNAILEEENNSLIQRIQIRSFKPKSGKGMAESNRNGNKLKRKYSLV